MDEYEQRRQNKLAVMIQREEKRRRKRRRVEYARRGEKHPVFSPELKRGYDSATLAGRAIGLAVSTAASKIIRAIKEGRTCGGVRWWDDRRA